MDKKGFKTKAMIFKKSAPHLISTPS